MVHWLREKLLQRDAIATDDEGALRLKGFGERVESGPSAGRTTALHLDGQDGRSDAHDEVHLSVAIAPVEQLTLSRGLGVGEMRANR